MRDQDSGELAVESAEAIVCRRILLEEILGKLSEKERALVLRLVDGGICGGKEERQLREMRVRLKAQGYSMDVCF